MGSGKTLLTTLIAQQLSWSRASFGDHVRATAVDRAEPVTREHLQQLGEVLIGEGWSTFCRSVLSRSHWLPDSNLIIDGIRHEAALDTLRSICAPSTVYLIYLATDADIRSERLRDRDFISTEQFQLFVQHPSEHQGDKLMSKGNLVLNGAKPIEELVRDVLDFIFEKKAADE